MATEVSSMSRDTQPYNCIGLIQVTYPDGTQARGTCTLVGRNDILTATHVLYSPDNGGWAENFDFYFGADFNDLTDQFDDSGYTYSPTSWDMNGWPEQAFTDSSNTTMLQSESQYDVALIGVNTPIGDTLGWLGLNGGYNGTYQANAVGYPVGATGMMEELVSVHKSVYYGTYESYYDVLGPGSSGGPLLIGDYVIGVKSTGTYWADVGFTINQLTSFIDDNNSLLSPPADITAPFVVSFTPTDNAVGVLKTADIVLTFNEAVQRGTGNIVLKTVTGTTLAIYDAASSSNLSVYGNTLLINPTTDLAYSTGYRVDFSAGSIKDLAGNSYAGTTSYNFTTTAPPDTTSPISTTFTPADESVAVPISANIILTFNEAVQRGTGNIVLKTTAGTTMAVFDAASSGNLSVSGNTLLINPTTDLAYSTGYRIDFAAGTIKDLAGNAYAGTTSYNFTTKPAPDTTAPSGIAFSPADEAVAVPVAGDIILTFSEAVQRGTGSIVLKTIAGSIVATYDAASSSNLSVSGNILTINPTADLAYNTGYKVTFTAGTIKDLAGNAYAGTTSYNFTTTSAPNTPIIGTAGNDRLTAGAGNDSIDGAGGIDTVVYSGHKSDYTLTKTDNHITIIDSVGRGGSDTLTSIERLTFSNSNIAFDIDGNAGQVAKILGAVFGPDAVNNTAYAGIGISLLDGGMHYEDLMLLALNTRLGAGFSVTDEVNVLYRNVIGFSPSQIEVDFFSSTITSGQYTQTSLAIMAAETTLNTDSINLVGIAQTGLEYTTNA